MAEVLFEVSLPERFIAVDDWCTTTAVGHELQPDLNIPVKARFILRRCHLYIKNRGEAELIVFNLINKVFCLGRRVLVGQVKVIRCKLQAALFRSTHIGMKPRVHVLLPLGGLDKNKVYFFSDN